eukprot:scaffold1781_cov371-Pinguiococcus_pyrenoidosus.AAC.6
MMASQLELMRLNAGGAESRVVRASHGIFVRRGGVHAAQAHAVPVPRPRAVRAGPGWRGCYGHPSVRHLPARQHLQAALREHGQRLSRGHERPGDHVRGGHDRGSCRGHGAAGDLGRYGWEDVLTTKKPCEDQSALILVFRRAGVMNDLGSGSNVDITVIRKEKNQSGERVVQRYRNMLRPNEVSEWRARINRPDKLRVALGATEVLTSTFTPAANPIVIEESEAMQL